MSSIYKLPDIKIPKISLKKSQKPKGPSKFFWFLVSTTLVAMIFGFLGGALFSLYFEQNIRDYLSFFNVELPEHQFQEGENKEEGVLEKQYISQEEAVISAVEKASPGVVSIIVTKDMPVFEEYYSNPFEGFEDFFGEEFYFQVPQYRQKGTEEREIGGGTGFIVSQDGLILTNKHVVTDEEAKYTVLTNDGHEFSAEVLARDPIQDIAILKIEKNTSLPVLRLGDSDGLKMGQTVIAIGNVLGEFRNSVSAGVISGLGRTITASGGGLVEVLEGIIQTDAAINKGNSGGPLLNLEGEVIGINTAMALEAENVGFAIPINKAKKDIKQVKELGKIVYPFLGIYYTLVTPELQEEYNLPVNYGAWVGRDASGQKASSPIFPDSAAEEAGILADDIILEFGGEKISLDNSLAHVILKYSPGDEVNLKILRNGEEKMISVVLGEREE
jgi:serine protease Do